MPPRSPRGRRAALVGALLLAACSKSSTGPTTSGLTNPTAANTAIQSVDTTFKTPALTSFTALAGQFVPASPRLAALVRATAPQLAARQSSYGAAAVQLLALRDGLASGALRFSIIPTTVRGRTYWLKSATGGYKWDTTATGAPTNGVRFILYQVTSAFQVVSPLVATGYVDLIDQSTGSTNALEVKIVVGTTTYADYTISGTESTGLDNLTLTGFVTDGTTMVNFTITFNENQSTGALTLQSSITAPAINFSYVFKLSATSSTSGGNTTTTIMLTYTLTDATDTMSATGTLTEVQGATSSESGTITVSANGQTFATITLSSSGATVTGSSGQTLNTTQGQAVSSLFASGVVLQTFVLFLIIPFAVV